MYESFEHCCFKFVNKFYICKYKYLKPLFLLLIKISSQYCVDLCICVTIQTVLSGSYLALLRFVSHILTWINPEYFLCSVITQMKRADIYQNRLHLPVDKSNNGPTALLIVTAVTALTDKRSMWHAKKWSHAR